MCRNRNFLKKGKNFAIIKALKPTGGTIRRNISRLFLCTQHLNYRAEFSASLALPGDP